MFFTLNIANNMLLESALSFLGAGVRPPERVLGDDDRRRLPDHLHRAAPDDRARPMIVLTVLSLNVFGDGLRDALDPRAKIRLEH